jgi:hypothetical protein
MSSGSFGFSARYDFWRAVEFRSARFRRRAQSTLATATHGRKEQLKP